MSRFEPITVAISRNPPTGLMGSRKAAAVKTEPAIKKRAEPSRFNIVTSKAAMNNYDLMAYAVNARPYQHQKATTGLVKQPEKKRKSVKVEDRSMKILTTTLANLIDYHLKLKPLNSHLFEVIAQLDSVVSDNGKGTRLFAVREDNARLQCVFNEIDRKLPKLVRNSFIRCVGHYNARRRALVCVSVRAANEDELFNNAMHCRLTDHYMLMNFQ